MTLGVPSDTILSGIYEPGQWDNVQEMSKLLGETKTYFITDNQARTINDIVSLIYHFKNRHNIRVVFIDHLGEIAPDELCRKEQSEYITLGRYVQTLKHVCGDLKIYCVLVHQFNRQGDKNADRINIGGSWKILQKTDLLLTLEFDEKEKNISLRFKNSATAFIHSK